MASDTATRDLASAAPAGPSPALAVLLSARAAAMSMRVSPTLHAQGLPSVVVDPQAPATGRLPALAREHPAQCIGFVDNPADVPVARALGLGLVVGLGSGSRAALLTRAGVDLTVGTPAELCAGLYYEAYAARYARLPDPLEDPPRFLASVGRPGEYGIFVDARALLRARDGAVAAALRELPAWVPVALLGGADLGAHASAFGLDRADILDHDGLGLAPDGLVEEAAPALTQAATRLGEVALAFNLPEPQRQGVGVRLHTGAAEAIDGALLRRAVVVALASVPGIEWESDLHGIEVRPSLNWPIAARVAALRARWKQRQYVQRVVLLSGSARCEPWLRALDGTDSGIHVGAAAVATAARWRLPGAGLLTQLLDLLNR